MSSALSAENRSRSGKWRFFENLVCSVETVGWGGGGDRPAVSFDAFSPRINVLKKLNQIKKIYKHRCGRLSHSLVLTFVLSGSILHPTLKE